MYRPWWADSADYYFYDHFVSLCRAIIAIATSFASSGAKSVPVSVAFFHCLESTLRQGAFHLRQGVYIGHPDFLQQFWFGGGNRFTGGNFKYGLCKALLLLIVCPLFAAAKSKSESHKLSVSTRMEYIAIPSRCID